MMLFFNPATVFGLVLALLVSLFASSPAPATGTPTAAALAPRATVALEKPQFPRTAVTCGTSRPYFMGFTRTHYVKMATRKLFRKMTFYGVEAGITERVICYRNAGIFVENYNDKALRIPFTTIGDMVRNIIYASCNRKKGHINGEQYDTRDKFAVIVAYSHCRGGPHRGTSILPPVVQGQEIYGLANRTGT